MELGGSKMGGGGFEAVVTGASALFSEADGAERQVEIVADDEQIGGGFELVEVYELCDGFADVVVESLGFGEDGAIGFDSFGEEFGCGLKGEIVGFGVKIEGQKAEIVAGEVVLPARITKADDEFHRGIISPM